MFQDTVGSQPAFRKEVRGKAVKGSALSRPIAFRKAGGQDADGSAHVEGSSGIGERSGETSDKRCFQKRGGGAAGAAGAAGAGRLPPPAKVVVAARAAPPAVSTDNAVQAKLRGQLTEERLALMAAMVVHTRTRAEGRAAGEAPPTAKELHAAVGEPRWKLPPTTMAAVKKAMSLLVAMQRAGMPPPTACAPP